MRKKEKGGEEEKKIEEEEGGRDRQTDRDRDTQREILSHRMVNIAKANNDKLANRPSQHLSNSACFLFV